MTDRPASTTTEPSCPQCGAPVSLPGYADMAVCAFCGSTLARAHERELEDEPERRPDQQTLRSVRCSQCAGPLSAREGKRVLICDHCGVRVAVLGQGGLSHWYFPARVNRIAAIGSGAAWLRDYPGIAKEARDAHFVEARLVYAPIWEHKALAAGWEFGYKLRTRAEFRYVGFDDKKEYVELQPVEERVKEPRLQERRFYQAATDLEALGAARPRFSGRELLVPLLAGELDPEATILPPEGAASEVAEKGRVAAMQPLSGAQISNAHVVVFRETMALLYYPLWLLRYQQGTRHCRVVVDGRSGTVNAGIAPADTRRQLATLAAQVGAMAATAAVLLFFGVTRESGRASLVAAAVIVSVAAVLLGRRFRAEKEVEYHEPFSG